MAPYFLLIIFAVALAFNGGREVESYNRKRKHRKRMAKGFYNSIGDGLREAFYVLFALVCIGFLVYNLMTVK